MFARVLSLSKGMCSCDYYLLYSYPQLCCCCCKGRDNIWCNHAECIWDFFYLFDYLFNIVPILSLDIVAVEEYQKCMVLDFHLVKLKANHREEF